MKSLDMTLQNSVEIFPAEPLLLREKEIHIVDRITFNPDQYGGRPCIRGMRIRVTDVLDLLANGLSFQEILDEMPLLEHEDIVVCLQFASKKIDHPIKKAGMEPASTVVKTSSAPYRYALNPASTRRL